ncbi:LOW QUALITY PROTEIN: olfactory receptor 5V1-like, partial [Liasis olivaceus]
LMALLGTEVFLLVVMAYDRVAICNPLYMVIMNRKLCLQMAAGSWITGFLNFLLHTTLTFTLPYCNFSGINQYYCDIPPVLALSCAFIYVAEMVVLIVDGISGVGAFLITLSSYTHIIATILMSHLANNRRKAFSTCSSHLTVVFLFYGTGIFTYIRPSSAYAMESNRFLALLYTVVTPSLNPVIYSLRNKEIKAAFKKSVARMWIIFRK